jgi:16S rRNA (cytosine1402-N4)-methyltransferase
MLTPAPHIPVLLEEVAVAMAVQPGEVHVDGTFGAGGYASALLSAGAQVHAFDRDPDAIAGGAALVAASAGALTLHHRCYSEMDRAGLSAVDGVVLDIGVSSMQFDQGERGFSYAVDALPDMRMAQDGESAADFLNAADEDDIANVIYRYGEEPKSRRVARAIVEARPVESTTELARIIRRATGWREGMKKDPAPRVFQAFRIHVNRELEELEDGLDAAERILKPGGRLCVVTFHSLEDRIVKRFMRERSGSNPGGSRHMPEAVAAADPSFSNIAKAVRPGAAELGRNPRARSATLRVAIRTEAPAWSAPKAGETR